MQQSKRDIFRNFLKKHKHKDTEIDSMVVFSCSETCNKY